MDAGFSAVIDPLQLVKQGKRLTGQLALQVLPRLAALCSKSASGKVEMDLQFGQGEDQKNRVTGSTSACFDVICQRCLEPMSLHLDCEINILLIDDRGDEFENGDGIVCKGKMPVAELIEDDLLLVMPMFPKHRAGDCTRDYETSGEQVKSAAKDAGYNKGQKTVREDNPFAVLAVLKSDKKTGNKPGNRSGKKSGKK